MKKLLSPSKLLPVWRQPFHQMLMMSDEMMVMTAMAIIVIVKIQTCVFIVFSFFIVNNRELFLAMGKTVVFPFAVTKLGPGCASSQTFFFKKRRLSNFFTL